MPQTSFKTTAHPAELALTPELLESAAAQGPVAVSLAYGFQLRESYGCGGSDATGYLLSDRPADHAGLAADRVKVGHLMWVREVAAKEAVAATTGPEPRFDATFTGTRREFERIHAAWSAAKAAAEQANSVEASTSSAWASLGYELVDISGVEASNTEYAEDDELHVLGHEVNHGCRCGHYGGVIGFPLDDEDGEEDGGLDARRFGPQPLAVITLNGWRWVTDATLLDQPDPSAEAAARLVALAHTWREDLDKHASDLVDLEKQVSAIPTEDQLLDMGPAEYAAAQLARKQLSSLTWKLSNAHSSTPGAHLAKASRPLRLAPVVPGFAERDSYGWRRGTYRTVEDQLCATPTT